jgi:hypothetical protein
LKAIAALANPIEHRKQHEKDNDDPDDPETYSKA